MPSVLLRCLAFHQWNQIWHPHGFKAEADGNRNTGMQQPQTETERENGRVTKKIELGHWHMKQN